MSGRSTALTSQEGGDISGGSGLVRGAQSLVGEGGELMSG